MVRVDPAVAAHLEWLGFVQPTGLVFSPAALVRAGAVLDRTDAEGQRLLRACVEERTLSPGAEPEPVVPSFRILAEKVLGWRFSPKGYAGADGIPIPPELEVTLPDYGDTLRPDLAVREREPPDGASPWQLLVQEVSLSQSLDRVASSVGGLEASPHGRMERLLRETGVPAGLLSNGRELRLISAPRGESSGWLDFRVPEMVQTAGRPISAALRLLLGEQRLLALPRTQRFAALLRDSRQYQNEVSEQLAQQVLHALYELLRGLQSAHNSSDGALLRQQLDDDPDEIYRGLLTVVLRLVFLLYAEEREMVPADDTFLRFYSLAGLHERLREDATHHPDTMNQRFGAWAQLLVLFRMIHDGVEAGAVRIPRRQGVLFDPDRYPFLEGRVGARQLHERVEAPLIPDGTVYRALDKLLVLDGERLSYRALDVEQIGSVYQTMMGFRLERATGRSAAIKAKKRHGPPTTVDLDALLAEPPANRSKWLQDHADRKPTAKQATAIRSAETLDDLHAALTPITDSAATPDLVTPGAMILQPSEERRRSGSHYTPRALTEPIVRTTLEPILDRLRGDGADPPHPEQILGLKVCDPAMGSGAFLVEVCRQLGDALIEAWSAHGGRPEVPTNEDEVVLARRMVAQRCLYGVDRNPVAVDLAKMSLWLVTLAREHALTFVDHALRHGDSLVGLSRRQIESFHWDSNAPGFEAVRIRDHLRRVTELRAEIRSAGEDVSDFVLRDRWDEAQSELESVQLVGNLVPAAFFSGAKAKDREIKRVELASAVAEGEAGRYRDWIAEWQDASPPLVPFHWEIEFPEVFDRRPAGFDAIVGNPPFAGGRNLSAAQGKTYSEWLVSDHEGSSGGADLVAHFFRRAFDLLRNGGAFGLIATNTIGQGDTRASGLRWICTHSGQIYEARKRVKWPGESAAVVVSVVHVSKGPFAGVKRLDGRKVDEITAFLFHRGGHDDPKRLAANAAQSFIGTYVLGMGFTFDDTDTKGVASSLADMDRLIAEDVANAEAVAPYIGGQEINTSPTHAHHRYVINLGECSEPECRERWPRLMEIVEERVKPERITKDANRYPRMVHEWWKYWNPRIDLYAAIANLDRVLVTNAGATPHLAVAFQPANRVFAHTLAVFPLTTYAAFCALQARPHEVWARFFGSTLEDRLRYTPSDCFETFPFPVGWQDDPSLEAAGRAYYDFRAALMIRHDEGLTKTYNRFHDAEERDPDLLRLRELHADMDRAVLDAYGWHDVPTDCDFILDYEVEDDDSGRRKKPYRYRWPDEVHDEVLARLIELNAERAAAERRAGADDGAQPRATSRVAAAAASSTEGLF